MVETDGSVFQRKGDVFRTLAGISLISSKLAYVPKVRFEEGLKKAIESWS